MTTLWVARLYFFVRASDLTLSIRNGIADRLAAGSGHTRAQELGMFTNPLGLSQTGSAPAQAYAWNTAIKLSMRDELKQLLDTLPNSVYYVVANTDVPDRGWVKDQLLQSNSENFEFYRGNTFTWQDALQDVATTKGVHLIHYVDTTLDAVPTVDIANFSVPISSKWLYKNVIKPLSDNFQKPTNSA